jgi:hypothetical protein
MGLFADQSIVTLLLNVNSLGGMFAITIAKGFRLS